MAGETEFVLRDFRMSDIPALVSIWNRSFPNNPQTVEAEEREERNYPADSPRLRFVVETAGGEVVGTAACQFPFWLEKPGVYWIHAVVDPAWRGRGIGRALCARLEPYAWRQGAERLWTVCDADQAGALRFLEAAGYRQYGMRIPQVLDLTQFDPERFAAALRRVADAGYTLTTFAEERKARPDAMRALYDLIRTTERDIPLPGGAVAEMPPYEAWRNWMVESPESDYDFIFLARRGAELAGVTAVDLREEGPANTYTTGVLREHRGMGVALALKVASLAALKARGYRATRTQNDTVNPAILHLNEKLGYRRLPGRLQYEKAAPQ
jgi:mycothiol synthase